ncbi:MAG: hypothetical protein FWD54_04805 [Endomicrobia bacterium]|nr:hypothetical protein [Endomicrobiia bacterium]MCL2799572.1 hypothetical protein [Endomicrobiia bacterium]
MKTNNKGITLVEILVSFLLVALTLVAGTAFFVKAFRYSYLYSDVSFNLDTGTNILEKQKRNAMAIIAGGADRFYQSDIKVGLSNKYALASADASKPSSTGGGEASFTIPRIADGVATSSGYVVTSTITGNSYNIRPTLLEVRYDATIEPENKPKFRMDLRTRYVYGMFRDRP